MKKIIFLILVTAFAIISCKKNFPVPKQPAEISPDLILTAALSGTASSVATNYIGLTRWMGYWARSGAFPPDLPTETYDIKNDYTDKEWTNIYLNLNIYNELEKLGRNNANPFYIGTAKAMKAYDFSALVDLYNDVPYKEAFDPATKNQPAYDKGQDIYNDLVAQLDSAFIYFENARSFYKQAPPSVAYADDANDIMFGSARSGAGSSSARLTLWEKFTNTLELKLLMHQSQVTAQQSFIQKEIGSITTSAARKAAGFLAAGESAVANPGYSFTSANRNPFYSLFYSFPNVPTKDYNYYKKNMYAGTFYGKANDPRSYLFYNGSFEKGISSFFTADPCFFYDSTAPVDSFYPDSNAYPILCNHNLDSNTMIFAYNVQGRFYIPAKYYTFGGITEGAFQIYGLSPDFSDFSSLKFLDTLPYYKLSSVYDGDNDFYYYGSALAPGPDSIVASSYIDFWIGYCCAPFLPGKVIGLGDNVGPGPLKKPEQDQLILSDFESLFLQTEAAQRGYTNGDAHMLYESAITQNFIYLYLGNQGNPLGDAKKYFSQSLTDVGWSASPNKLEAIMTQKWAAMNGINWVEAYNDYRRTGYPTSNVLGISHAPTHIRPQIPTRFLYPQSQLNTNSANVPALPDAQYSKVFWNQ